MTPAGRGTVLAAIAITALGIGSGYPVVSSLGLTLLIAAAMAVVLAGRDVDIECRRIVVPERVVAGQSSEITLRITNRGKRTFGATRAQEFIGDEAKPISIPAIEPGASITVRASLPTERRGIYQIGPLVVRHGDPIGLAQRGRTETGLTTLIVHPRIHEISPFPTGMNRDLEGVPSGEAAEGGITFANLREYVPGDDVRLIHWRSSARTDRLLVRHNVDVQRPRTTIVLDTTSELYSVDSFDDAIRAVASIISACRHRLYPFSVYTTDGQYIDETSPITLIMDTLAGLQPVERHEGTIETTVLKAARGRTGLACALITGRSGTEALAALGPLRTRFDRLTIIRMGAGPGVEVHDLSGATLMNVATSTHFAQAWNRKVGR